MSDNNTIKREEKSRSVVKTHSHIASHHQWNEEAVHWQKEKALSSSSISNYVNESELCERRGRTKWNFVCVSTRAEEKSKNDLLYCRLKLKSREFLFTSFFSSGLVSVGVLAVESAYHAEIAFSFDSPDGCTLFVRLFYITSIVIVSVCMGAKKVYGTRKVMAFVINVCARVRREDYNKINDGQRKMN